jgi:hypothetical protein
MSGQIADLGDRLIRGIQQFFPEFVEQYNSGISRSEIDQALPDLSGPLPEEFYALYHWRNGHQDGFWHPVEYAELCHFSSLEELVQYLVGWRDDWVPPTYLGLETLPFISGSGGECDAIILGRQYETQAYIAEVGESGDIHLRYDSITTMLSTTVECFERGVFYINNEGWFAEDEILAAEILCKNNPKVFEECMADIMNAINTFGFDEKTDIEEYYSHVKRLLSGLSSLRRFKPPQLISLIQEKLDLLKSIHTERARSAKHSYREWLQWIDPEFKKRMM